MYIIERVRLVQRFVFTEAQIMVRQNMDALDLVLVLCEKTTQQRDVHRSIIDARDDRHARRHIGQFQQCLKVSVDLLIRLPAVPDMLLFIDDFAISRYSEEGIKILYHLLKLRDDLGTSTLFSCQYSPDEWGKQLSDENECYGKLDGIRRRLTTGFTVLIEKA